MVSSGKPLQENVYLTGTFVHSCHYWSILAKFIDKYKFNCYNSHREDKR